MAQTYSPLEDSSPHIRLLRFEHISVDHISCELLHVPLDNAPHFVALSYVWGHPTEGAKEIKLNGQSITVTANLAEALLHARTHWSKVFPGRSKDEFLLWADAICINQKDYVEIGKQMVLMGPIYRSAQLVISWLCDNSFQTKLALDTFDMIASAYSTRSAEEFLMLDFLKGCGSLRPEDVAAAKAIPGFDEQRWTAILRIWDLKYWSRVWIFQEVALAQELILCTDSTSLSFSKLVEARKGLLCMRDAVTAKIIHLRDIPEASKIMRTILTASHVNWGKIQRIVEEKTKAHRANGIGLREQDTVEGFLMSLSGRSFQATAPKDHIYGLQGLSGLLGLKPELSSEVTVGKVYADYINLWFRIIAADTNNTILPDNGVLFFLYLGGTGVYENPLGLPSWVPNFPAESLAQIAFDTMGAKGKASENIFSPTDPKPSIRGLSLFVPGIEIDQITVIECGGPEDAQGDSLLNYFQRYVAANPRYPTGIPPLQAIARAHNCWNKTEADEELILYTVHMLHYYIGLDHKDRDQIYRALGLEPMSTVVDNSAYDYTLINNIFPGYGGPIRDWKAFSMVGRPDVSSKVFADWSIITWRWAFIETRNGYLGLGPLGAQPGDSIFVLKSFGLLAIMRRVDEHWNLVGCSFIVGLMNGEIADLDHPVLQLVEIR